MLAARTMSEIPYPTKFVIDPKFIWEMSEPVPLLVKTLDVLSSEFEFIIQLAVAFL